MFTKKFKQTLLVLFFLFAVMTILSACGGAPAAEAPTEEPAAPEAPAEPVEPSEGFPVTYGQDSRTEILQHTDTNLQTMGDSVAILVKKDQVKISDNSVTLDGHTLNEISEMGWLVNGSNAPICTGELFATQAAPGFCTGFLVKEDVLVTAGHCLERAPCSDIRIVFGFYMQADNSPAALTQENVFKCSGVIAHETPTAENSYLDYAIIKLDRLTGRAALDYATGEQLEAQDPVAVIGYPSGLPLKVASNAFVMSNKSEDPFFIANLDTFGGNSGSPVINMDTYQVEGIVVSGMPDYTLSNDGTCIQVNRCPDSGGINCAGEIATKMEILTEKITETTAENPSGLNCFPNLLLVLSLVSLAKIRIT